MPPNEPGRCVRRPRILCAGIAVLDQVFRVAAFPRYDDKTEALGFASVVGGGAANAAITIARLGGEARFAGPLGGASGEDPAGDRIVRSLAGDGVDCSGCVRLAGATSPVSAIFVDAQGGRTITCHRDARLRAVKPGDPDQLVADVDGVLADDHCPEFATPVCAAARRRGLPVVLDIEKPAAPGDPLFAAATHRVFSRAGLVAAAGLPATAGADDLAAALARLRGSADASMFLAATDGPGPIHWCAGGRCGRVLPFAIEAVDTLAAGDVFHGAFVLALLEWGDAIAALRFAAAAAAIKCTRFGGGAAAPTRPEVERLLRDGPS